MAANLCVSNLMDCLLNKSSENVPSTNSGAFSEMVLLFANDLTWGEVPDVVISNDIS